MEILASIFILCGVLAGGLVGYEHLMFYRAWRLQRLQLLEGKFQRDNPILREHRLALDAPFSVFSGNLSAECRVHRRRLFLALSAFLGFFVLGTISMYSAHG